MALINRVSRLFKADMHAVLDQIEEPEQVLRQAIRDMEDELQSAEQEIAACAHECEVLGKRRAAIAESITETNGQLDLCFESGKDELARGLIRRKLESERMQKHLEGRLDRNTDFLAEQRRLLNEKQGTLESLRQKADIFTRQVASAADFEFDESAWFDRAGAVSDEEIEIAFLREQAERTAS